MLRHLRRPFYLVLAVGAILASCTPEGVYPAPSFKLEALDGGKIMNREDFKGKVVVIDFWQTWCGPCRALMPHLEKLYQTYKDKGVLVIGVTPEERPLVEQFHRLRTYTYPVYLDPDANTNSAFQVSPIPRTVIMSRSGDIVFDAVGPNPEVLEEALRKAL